MGYGDWIMASADVKRVNEETGKKVYLGDGKQYHIDDSVLIHNPRLAKEGDTNIVWVDNYPAKRPYMLGTKDKHIIFNNNYSPQAGEIYFTDAEIEWADKHAPKDFILVEPNVKAKFIHTVNKSWPYFEQLKGKGLPLVQVGGKDTKPIFGFVQTDSFRQAMLILSKAKLFVGTDGGLHHAAAALGIPAVVIWTGFTSPKHLGYKEHINLHDGSEPCGYFGGVCEHCAEKAKNITAERVLDAIHTIWR